MGSVSLLINMLVQSQSIVDRSIGTVPGFKEFVCMMGFGVANDFVPVEKELFAVSVFGDQGLGSCCLTAS